MLLAAGGTGIGLVPVFYVVSILAILGGGLGALLRWQKSQRKQWQQEGMHAQKQAEALIANTEAATRNTEANTRNTEAISNLAGEMRAFVAETRARFSEQNGRIERLENRRRPGN